MDRRHSMSGKKDLDWFFANKRWVRTRERTVVEAAYAIRPLPPDSAPVKILLLAPKRSYKRAHDRNHIKRWLRESVQNTLAFSSIEQAAEARELQVLVLLRCQKPLPELSWDAILAAVQNIANSISEKVTL